MPDIGAIFAPPWGPLLIFALRICDVSLDTMRVLFAVRGKRGVAGALGFFQALIWIFAVGNAVRHLDSGRHVLGYAGGYATGSVLGLKLEERLAIGYATIRVVSRRAGVALADALRTIGFGVTEFAGQGRDGPVEVIYTVCMRRDIPRVIEEVERWDAQAFITVEEPRDIRWGWMRTSPRNLIGMGMLRRVAGRMRWDKEP